MKTELFSFSFGAGNMVRFGIYLCKETKEIAEGKTRAEVVLEAHTVPPRLVPLNIPPPEGWNTQFTSVGPDDDRGSCSLHFTKCFEDEHIIILEIQSSTEGEHYTWGSLDEDWHPYNYTSCYYLVIVLQKRNGIPGDFAGFEVALFQTEVWHPELLLQSG